MYVNPKGKGKHNIVKNGDIFVNNSGEKIVVIDYRGATDVIVQFEDGATRITTSLDLRKGGCRHPEKYTSIVGKRFENNLGEWATVKEYRSATEVIIEFDGYPNKTKTIESAALRNKGFRNNYKPTVFGVGYLGEGEYQGSEKDGTVIAYTIWYKMIARSYDDKTQKLQPAYIGCSVDPYFHSFQNFADYYINHQCYGLGFHIDKDLLVRGNRVYGPDTCTMLPPEVNSALASTPTSESGLPLGVNKIDDGYVARLNKTGQGREYLGYYKTPEEAHNVYVKAKEEYVHSLAEKWKGKIEDRAYQALRNWTVYPKEENQYVTC